MEEIKYNYINSEVFDETLNKELDTDGDSLKITSKIMLDGDTQSSLIINVNHRAQKTTSYVKIRAILKDGARLKVFGDLHIEKDANDTDAYFEAKILILGNKARAIALPKLRIENRLVKAKHAVVIKKISNEDFYFLESRGISNKKAQDIIAEGFLNS